MDSISQWLVITTEGKQLFPFLISLLLPAITGLGFFLSTSDIERIRFIGRAFGIVVIPIWIFIVIVNFNLACLLLLTLFAFTWVYRFASHYRKYLCIKN